MRKLVYFIPAILFSIFYSLVVLSGTLHPFVIIIVGLLWLAGFLLSKSIFWGGLIGFLPGVCFIYMGTQDTGQIIKETPAGIIIILYYAVCMIYCIYRKKRRKG